MDASKPIVFYDIASGPPITCFAPNPWKTRYALNFKKVHYKTHWVEFKDIKDTRLKLGPAPNRLLPDGSDFYTLPIIQDLANGEIVGDSFEIALYLDKAYPESPTLLPPSTIGLHKAFNIQVDALFTRFAGLCSSNLPFNPKTAEADRATFVKRWGLKRWEDLKIVGDDRVRMFADFKAALGDLAKTYTYTGGGPFVEGDHMTYADIIIGGWLAFAKATLSADEWKNITTWQDGLWGRLHSALQQYAQVN